MKIAIVGGGAAGIFCAGLISKKNEVTVYEKNATLGKKLLITGNGRCNVTNLKSSVEFLSNVLTNSKFLYSSINNFSPSDLCNYLEQGGVKLVEEENNKIYPSSAKARTILEFFVSQFGSNVLVRTSQEVTEIIKSDTGFYVFANENQGYYDKVIVATGGKSYPLTGSTGDGYRFAATLGHNVVNTRQNLCGFIANNEILKHCEGVQFVCRASIINENNEALCSDFGSIMVTSFGLSGPLAFNLSAKYFESNIKDKYVSIDFAYEFSKNELLQKIDEFVNLNSKKEISDFVSRYLVKRFALVLKQQYLELLSTTSSELTKAKREEVVELLKNFKIKITDFDSYDRAIVTRGGVDTREISPKTMESKIVSGLYFLGEVIDVDALTGGYSLQIAFSTAYACANHINSLNK